MMYLLLALSPAILYLRIFWGFFQQDEWLGYSQFVLHRGQTMGELLVYFFTPSIGHFTPFTIATVHGLFGLFNLNYQAYAAISIGLHVMTGILVFVLAKNIFKDVRLAALTAFLFGIFASPFQGTAWVIADLAGHLSEIFRLLSIIYLFMPKLTNTLLFFMISLLFKEITIGLFLLIPIMVYTFNLKIRIKIFLIL